MQPFSLLRLLRKFDDFGYPISLRYKGEKTYQSFVGGVLSLLVSFLTLLIVIFGMRNVLFMRDPKVTSFPRPVSAEERQSLAENGLRFDDFDFNIAFQVVIIDEDGNDSFELPLEHARMHAFIRNKETKYDVGI